MSNHFQQLIDSFWDKTLLKLIPKNLTPNHLTLVRLVLIPVILYWLMTNQLIWALIFFVLAALTDSLDGSLARKRKQISKWGLILDPLADKLLIILSALFMILYYPYLKIILGVIIIDALIILESVAFMLLKRELKVPPANWLGKSKMVFQVFGLFLTILYLLFDSLVALQLSVIFFYLVIIIGVFNLVNYALRSLKMFK